MPTKSAKCLIIRHSKSENFSTASSTVEGIRSEHERRKHLLHPVNLPAKDRLGYEISGHWRLEKTTHKSTGENP